MAMLKTLAIVAVILLLLFVGALVVLGLTSGLEMAAALAGIWLACLGLIPVLALGALFFGGIWGLRLAQGKLPGVFAAIQRGANAADGLAMRLGGRAVRPLIWLYAGAAYLDTLARALWRRLAPAPAPTESPSEKEAL